jgi:acetyl-CoA carboxylase alpha subunit
VDDIVPEPDDWRIDASKEDEAKNDPKFIKIAERLKASIERNLSELEKVEPQELVKQRYNKFRKMGDWV